MLGRLLAVDTAELLIADDDARFDNRRKPVAAKRFRVVNRRRPENRAKLAARLVIAAKSAKRCLRSERANIQRDIRGTARHVAVLGNMDHGNRSLGGNTRRVAVDIVVEHHVADDQNTNLGYFFKQASHRRKF